MLEEILMSTIIYKDTAKRPGHKKYLEALYEGIKLTDDCSLMSGYDYQESNIAVIFGSCRLEKKKMVDHMLKKKIIDEHQGHLLYLESALLGRKPDPSDNDYWRMGWNHFMFQKGKFGFTENPSPDRFNKLQSELDIDLKHWKQGGDYILITMQSPNDASLFGLDVTQWAKDVVHDLSKITDMDIKVRPHPQTKPKHLSIILDQEFNADIIDPTKSTIYDDIQDAYCVVTYTSGSAIDCIVSGTPVIALHPASMAWPVAGHSLQDVLNPPKPARENYLYNLAYAQWNIEEMRSGEAWEHLKSCL